MMLRRLHELLESKGIESSIVGDRLILRLLIEDTPVRLSATLSRDFPRSLPKFHLLDRSKYGSLAHVGWTPDFRSPELDVGLICDGVSVSRSIDFDAPEEVFQKALEQVQKTLAESLLNSEANRHDVQKEFAGHWAFTVTTTPQRVVSFIEPGETIREIQAFVCTEGAANGQTILTESSKNTANESYEYQRRLRTRSRVEGKAFYIPLPKGTMPPRPGESVLDWWTTVLKDNPGQPTNDLSDLARRTRARSCWILGSVKTVVDKNNWFAIKFTSELKANVPLNLSSIGGWKATALSVAVHNKETLLPRGGATAPNTPKKVAVVGCGSIGGEIARMVAAAGVDKLTLVDPDLFEIENVYRHTLSSGKIGLNKAVALAEELQAKFPYLTVSPKRVWRLEDCLDSDFLEEHEGIIVATGDATAERYFDSQLQTLAKRPWVVYCWVEGLGVGGHAVYVHSTGPGCLSCLFRDSEGNLSLGSIQNFIVQDQEVAVDISGCGTHFLPYSYVDAVQSAILAARLTLRALERKLSRSCRVSWKGNVDRDPAVEMTHRFEAFGQSLVESDLRWVGCHVCEPK